MSARKVDYGHRLTADVLIDLQLSIKLKQSSMHTLTRQTTPVINDCRHIGMPIGKENSCGTFPANL